MSVIQPKTIVISGLTNKVPLNPKHIYFPESREMETDDIVSDGIGMDGVRKRKRLTHLSQEERMLRRKLKNRVAAQTARDRKKARMEELEEAMIRLEAQNKQLFNENRLLQKKTECLLQENCKMKAQLSGNGVDTKVTVEKSENNNSSDVAMVGGYAPPESAVLKSSQQKVKAHTLLNLTTHCLAFLMTLSVTNSLGYSNRSQKSLLPLLQHRLKRLQNPAIMKTLSPKLKKHLQERWWGPQQKSWNPSRN